ncbi:LysM peptidoglycan-binding domain-containing protein [Pragia fontium]|uniref:ParB-like nuclease domain-containing protein n=1 Tax=Pragia fontium DSM 5563 = ATCC 49100 TaxID=1122977 RepID=A0AAJ5BFW7_9GAMM|nr:LysM domain-containing protein [Pragia fontium]SFC07508.1 ParB-like nuclease domain-containing protein [Pragia fontium DSM 5563 = ATCC 49100]
MSRVDYFSWPKMSLSVSNLKLDRNNPRIPPNIPTRTTKEILEYLIKNQEVKDIADKIVHKGFIPHEPIYVTKEKDSYVVLEGNRRVSALKCLLDPLLSPSSQHRYFQRLHNLMSGNPIEKIDVIVAPSREEAEDVLFELHTERKKEWSRLQKNAFIARAAVQEGETIEQIAERFNVNVTDIQAAVTEHYLSSYLIELDLPSDIEEKALSEKFHISTLGRIVGNSTFLEFVGMRIEGTTLKTDIPTFKFNSLLKKIVTDIIEKKINSRVLNDKEAISSYIEKISTLLPETGENITPVSFSLYKGNSPPVPTPQPKKTRSKTEMLIPKGKIYETGNIKLDILINEGQKIQAGKYMYSSAFLLRTILEMTILRIFESQGKLEICLNDRQRTHNLSQNIKSLTNRPQWFQNQAHLNDLLSFIAKDSPRWVSLETLNRYVHGEFTIPDKEMLTAIWLIIEPLVLMCNKECN